MVSRRDFLKLSLFAVGSLIMPLGSNIKNGRAECSVKCGDCNEYKINNENCYGCNLCLSICLFDAIIISSDNEYYINQDDCWQCGACFETCPSGAIICSDGQHGCIDPHGDKDGDGLTNEQECEFGSSPCAQDTDHDGLTDLKEYQLGSSPNDKDTDNDGFDDRIEYLLGTNLKDKNSKPKNKNVVSYAYDALGRIKSKMIIR